MKHRSFAALALVVAIVGCKDDAPVVATKLTLATAPSPSAQNRVVLATQPSVQLTDDGGRASPTGGVVVTAAVKTAGATLSGTTTATTNGNGVATFTDLAVQGVAGVHEIEFSAPSLTSVTAPVTTTPGVATNIAVSAGNNQTATVNTAVATAPSVIVTDPDGNPVGSVAVSFTIASGAGAISGGSQTTGTNGIATITSWTLGTTAGANTLNATNGILIGSPVTFTATGTAGNATKLVFGTPMSTTAPNRVPFATQPAIRLQDAFSNNVSQSGVTVGASIVLGDGTLQGTTSVATDANGVATFTNLAIAGIAGSKSLAFNATGLTGTSIPVTTTAGAAAAIAINGGNNQSALQGTAVPNPPSVKVTDQDGNLVGGGVAVTFAVTSGGGSATGTSATTNSSGVATVGSWTLGSSAGTNTLSATSAGLSGSPVTFTAIAGATAYDIELVYLTSATQAQQDAFNAAVARWRQIITGDVGTAATGNVAANACFSGQPALNNEAINDLRIYVKLEPIDGANGVLGSAGPCQIRNGNQLTVWGLMRFDTADLETLELSGRLTDVILHEMGHVIGIGTLWQTKSLLVGAGGGDPFFTGAEANVQFDAIGGTAYPTSNTVPVENTGGAGTRDSHWRESEFDNELMTGFLNIGTNPLSVMTIGSLKDLGYTVDLTKGDSYNWTPMIRGQPPKLHLGNDIHRAVQQIAPAAPAGTKPGPLNTPEKK